MFELKEPWKLIGALIILISLLLVIIFLQIKIDNTVSNTQPIIVKQETVHDTVWKNKDFSIKPKKPFGYSIIHEIHSKRTDEIVFYIEPNIVEENVKKSGGKKLTRISQHSDDMCEVLKKEIICMYSYADRDNKYHEFYKEFPSEQFYMITTVTDIYYDELTTTGPINWD